MVPNCFLTVLCSLFELGSNKSPHTDMLVCFFRLFDFTLSVSLSPLPHFTVYLWEDGGDSGPVPGVIPTVSLTDMFTVAWSFDETHGGIAGPVTLHSWRGGLPSGDPRGPSRPHCVRSAAIGDHEFSL